MLYDKALGHMAEMPIKHELKPSALLALRQHASASLYAWQELGHALTVLKYLTMNT